MKGKASAGSKTRVFHSVLAETEDCESPSPIPPNLHRKDAKRRKYYSEVRFIAVVCYLFQYSREAYVTLAELLEAPSIGAFWTGLVHQKTITERSIGISRSRRRIIGCHIHKGAVAF
jgi:hypothetical protein